MSIVPACFPEVWQLLLQKINNLAKLGQSIWYFFTVGAHEVDVGAKERTCRAEDWAMRRSGAKS
ncbi:MAG: hypothetical protein ACWGMZ_12245, partial [Thermoguttaceae bacterium]